MEDKNNSWPSDHVKPPRPWPRHTTSHSERSVASKLTKDILIAATIAIGLFVAGIMTGGAIIIQIARNCT